MRNRKLDDNNDMIFGHSQSDFYRDQVEVVAQAVLTRLKLWTGEWFLDVSEGTPIVSLMGQKAMNLVDPIFRDRILGTPGVTEIVDMSITTDPDSRKVSLTARINTIYGQTAVQGTI